MSKDGIFTDFDVVYWVHWYENYKILTFRLFLLFVLLNATLSTVGFMYNIKYDWNLNKEGD
jgi:hypothetical protein